MAHYEYNLTSENKRTLLPQCLLTQELDESNPNKHTQAMQYTIADLSISQTQQNFKKPNMEETTYTLYLISANVRLTRKIEKLYLK